MSSNPIPYYDSLSPSPSPEPAFSFLARPDLSHKRLHPSPTPGTSILTAREVEQPDGASTYIAIVLVDDASGRELWSITFGEFPDVGGWDRFRRQCVRQMAQDSGRAVEEMRAVLRAGEEADRVRRGLLGEHEGEGQSLVGEAEGMEEEEGR